MSLMYISHMESNVCIPFSFLCFHFCFCLWNCVIVCNLYLIVFSCLHLCFQQCNWLSVERESKFLLGNFNKVLKTRFSFRFNPTNKVCLQNFISPYSVTKHDKTKRFLSSKSSLQILLEYLSKNSPHIYINLSEASGVLSKLSHYC